MEKISKTFLASTMNRMINFHNSNITAEAQSRPQQTFKMDNFETIVNGWKQVTVAKKLSIADIEESLDYTSERE